MIGLPPWGNALDSWLMRIRFSRSASFRRRFVKFHWIVNELPNSSGLIHTFSVPHIAVTTGYAQVFRGIGEILLLRPWGSLSLYGTYDNLMV